MYHVKLKQKYNNAKNIKLTVMILISHIKLLNYYTTTNKWIEVDSKTGK